MGFPRFSESACTFRESIAIVLLWAFRFTAIRYAVSHGFAPLTYAPLRWTIAALAFSAVTWRLEGSLRVARRDFGVLVALAAVGVWVNQTARAYAVRLTGGATVALLWAATSISFAGVALVAVGGGGRISAHLGGVAHALVTAASFAVYSVGVVPLAALLALPDQRRHGTRRRGAPGGLELMKIGCFLSSCSV